MAGKAGALKADSGCIFERIFSQNLPEETPHKAFQAFCAVSFGNPETHN
jgi:hypothetical protein